MAGVAADVPDVAAGVISVAADVADVADVAADVESDFDFNNNSIILLWFASTVFYLEWNAKQSESSPKRCQGRPRLVKVKIIGRPPLANMHLCVFSVTALPS